MHIVKGRNVNEVYARAVRLVRTQGVLQPSRAGDVLSVLEPVVLETRRPTERVLMDFQRDANPFFHFFEALWMLAGRRDGRFLDRFVHDFSDRFGEEDGTIWGAYGHRWRKFYGDLDQLDVVVGKLRDNPLDRRVVIGMWSPDWDLCDPQTRDVPCNTHIYPRIVPGAVDNTGDSIGPVLDLMVMCRSNDVVWGATGANAVHFPFLQEYLAGRIGVQVGTLRQMTTNLHGYTTTLAKVGEPDGVDPYRYATNFGKVPDFLDTLPIGTDWAHWDEELSGFLQYAEMDVSQFEGAVWRNRWFADTAYPMWMAHTYWRLGHKKDTYMGAAQQIAAPDWRAAALQWLSRRKPRSAE